MLSKYMQQKQDHEARILHRLINDGANEFGKNHAQHTDDAQGQFAAELVKETVKELMRRKYPEFRWAQGELVKFNRGGHPGARVREWYEHDVTGEADFISDIGDDAPSVSQHIIPHVNRYARIGIKMIVTDADVERANLQGLFSVATELATAAKRGYQQKLNDLVLNGDESRGLSGARALPGSLRFANAGPAWDTATPVEMAATIVSVISAIFDGSNTVYKPNTLVMPSNRAVRLHELQNSVASDVVLMNRIKEVFGADSEFPIKNWVFDHTMNTAADDGGPALLAYNDSNEFLEGLLPIDFKPARAKQEPMHMEQLWWGKYGGIAIYHPRSIALVSGI